MKPLATRVWVWSCHRTNSPGSSTSSGRLPAGNLYRPAGNSRSSDHDAADTPLILVGPAAFPDIPEGAEDLPHILDLPSRELGRETVATGAEQRFREDAAKAVRAGDDDRIAELLDVSYDLEAWGPVALASARALLDEATHAN